MSEIKLSCGDLRGRVAVAIPHLRRWNKAWNSHDWKKVLEALLITVSVKSCLGQHGWDWCHQNVLRLCWQWAGAVRENSKWIFRTKVSFVDHSKSLVCISMGCVSAVSCIASSKPAICYSWTRAVDTQIELIVGSENGKASSTDILNSADTLTTKKLKKSETEHVLNRLVHDKWLNEVKHIP